MMKKLQVGHTGVAVHDLHGDHEVDHAEDEEVGYMHSVRVEHVPDQKQLLAHG